MTAIGAVGLLSLVLLVKAFRSDGGFRGLSPSSMLLFAAVVLPSLTLIAGVYLAQKVVLTDQFFNRIVQYQGLALQINQVASPLLLGIALLLAMIQMQRGSRLNPAALVFGLLLAVSALARWGNGGNLMDGGQLTLLVVVLAAAVMPSGKDALRGAALGVGLLLSLSAIAALVQPSLAAPPCDNRKCGLLGTFYVGVADNQNTFGLMMAFAIPVFYFGLSRYKIYFVTLATVLAFASGARTAAIAAGLAATVIFLVHVGRKRGSKAGGIVASLLTLGAVAATVVVPFIQLTPGTFSDRAGLWALARQLVTKQWFLGYGPNEWRSLVDIGVIPRAAGYSTHNQAMETLFVAGALGVGLMVVTIVLVLGRSGGQLLRIATIVLPVAVAAVTERPWSLGGVDWASWSLVLFLCLGALSVRQEAGPANSGSLAAPALKSPSR